MENFDKPQADEECGEAIVEGGKKQKAGKADEHRVKQVTFVETKERRKRSRNVMNQLRTQMEFYFGDANLNKDRFMKEETDKDPEGYIPISVFMKFRNIETLTKDQDLLVKALKLSTFLKVSEDGTKVRRTTPVKVMTQEEIDDRTIYVEGFHKFIAREWIKKKFSKCGTVTYISLPRFKSTNEIKGYAFVEFEHPEEAEKAVQMLNSVHDEPEEKPDEKAVSASVKQTKNLTYWKKRATKEGIDPAEIEAGLKEVIAAQQAEEAAKEGATKTKSKKKRKKKGQGEAPPPDSGTAAQQKTNNAVNSGVVKDESKENETKPEAANNETEDTKVKKSKKSKKRRKRKNTNAAKAAEDSFSQSAVDSQNGAAVVKENCEKGVKSEGAEDSDKVDVNSEEVVMKQEKDTNEASNKTGRKRPRTDDDTTPEVSSAKKSKPDPDKAANGKEGTSNGREEKEPSDTAQQAMQTDTGMTKRKTSQDDVSTKQADAQKGTGKRRRVDSLDTSQDKTAKAKKQKEGKQSRRSLDQAPEATPAESRKRKRKSADGGGGAEGSSSHKRKKGNADGEEGEGKSKRHRRHKLPEPDMRLRVMTKKTWTHLKKDYLEQQKANMRKLKDMLKEASLKRKQANSKNSNGGGQQEEGGEADNTAGDRPPPEFVPNVLLEVKSEAELCLQSIKANVPTSVQVAYIDVRPGMTEGYIRCKNAESAAKLLKTGLRGLNLSQIEGDAEVEYWNKLIADRQHKLSDTKRRKRRGKLKILQRAQNPQEEINQRQHLIFTEDDAEEGSAPSMPDDFNAYSGRVHFSKRKGC